MLQMLLARVKEREAFLTHLYTQAISVFARASNICNMASGPDSNARDSSSNCFFVPRVQSRRYGIALFLTCRTEDRYCS